MKLAIVLIYLTLVLLSVVGYVLNIFGLIHHVGFGMLEAFRIVGIFVPPLGAVMGYI